MVSLKKLKAGPHAAEIRQDREWLEDHTESGTNKATRSKSDVVAATEYAHSWACAWSDPQHQMLTEEDLELLQHVNCEYLSSGKAPTLLALKQHAQSLTNLIRKITVSTSFGIINAKGQGREHQFKENEAFDWLNDLDTPYNTNDAHHLLPLYTVMNSIKKETQVSPEETRLGYHCPLEPVTDFGPLAPKKDEDKAKSKRWPYQTHHNLLMHANECLEILDHNYSATGGLLSILPDKEENAAEQMAGVRNTLIGQWLQFSQVTIARMHELEINLCHALNVLSGEAVVPTQMLSNIGPEGRLRGRPVAYPQDRYVLANAGDDVSSQLHRMLDAAELEMEDKEKQWRDNGVSGTRMSQTNKTTGEQASLGLVSLETTSRFYRIKGQGNRGTIFVVPYVQGHPALQTAKGLEARPTFISMPNPSWPEHATALQQRYASRLEEGETALRENQRLKQEITRTRNQLLDMSLELNEVKRKLKGYGAMHDSGVVEDVEDDADGPPDATMEE